MLFHSQRRVLEYIEDNVMCDNYKENFERDLFDWLNFYEKEEYEYIVMNMLSIYIDTNMYIYTDLSIYADRLQSMTSEEKENILKIAYNTIQKIHCLKGLDQDVMNSMIEQLIKRGLSM